MLGAATRLGSAGGQRCPGPRLFKGSRNCGKPFAGEVRRWFNPVLQSLKEGSVLEGRASPALRSLKEFQNSVERTSWRAAAFTHDSEHVIGAAGASSRESSMSGMSWILYLVSRRVAPQFLGISAAAFERIS